MASRFIHWIFGVLLLTAPVLAADPVAGELVGLNVSLAAQKQLAVCDQLLAGEEWENALDLLEKFQADQSDGLILSSPGLYIGLRFSIQQRLCALPPAGLEVYRRRTATVTETLLKQSRLSGDTAALERLSDEFAASTSASEATDRLAATYILRGDPEHAYRLWNRMRSAATERHPGAEPLFRVESSHSAETKWTTIQRLWGNETESDLLPGHDSTPHDSDLVRINGSSVGTPSHLRWSTLATENSPLPEMRRALSIAIHENRVVLNNGEEIRCLNLADGRPAWPSGQSADVGVIHRIAAPKKDRQDVPCRLSGLVRHGERCFGVAGDVPRWSPRTVLIPETSELFCIDLGLGEGKILWRVESSALPVKGWKFHGPPQISYGVLPDEDQVVIPICRAEQPVELGLAGFRSDDGTLQWWTRVGTAVASANQPIPESSLVVKGGLACIRTLTGVLAAIQVRTGQIQWGSTDCVASPIVQMGSSDPLVDLGAGNLVAVDPVAQRVVARSCDSGQPVWDIQLPQRIWGVTVPAQSSQVLISGQRLTALSLLDGHYQWSVGTGDPLDTGTGIPSIAGNVVVWPTRNSVWGIELSSGRVLFRRPLSARPLAVPMRILATEPQFLMTLPDELAVFESR